MKTKWLLISSTLIVALALSLSSCKKETMPIKKMIEDSTGQTKEYILINIYGAKNTNGKMNIALYSSESSFNDPNQAFREYIIDATTRPLSVKLDSIPPGTYAFALFHDENKNKNIDKNALGIPKEGFAFSNNAFGTFGPPKYKDAKFDLAPQNFVSFDIDLKFY